MLAASRPVHPSLMTLFAAAAAVALFAAFSVAPQWFLLHNHYLYYFDIGLYSQALQHFSWHTPNPTLSITHVGIFNDHFDPIWILAKPLTPWLTAPAALLLTEAACVSLGVLPLLYLHARGRLSSSTTLTGILLVLFNLAVSDAVDSPVHPTTWAAGPMVCLLVGLDRRSRTVVFLSLLALFACKEELPFAGLCLGIVLLRRKDYSMGAMVLALSLGWIAVAFPLRTALLGPCVSHASKLYAGMLDNPREFWAGRLLNGSVYSRIGSIVAPLLPLLLWLRLKKVAVAWWPLAFLLPILAIRLLGVAWRDHYNAYVAAALAIPPILAAGRRAIPLGVVLSCATLLITTNSTKLRNSIDAWRQHITAPSSEASRIEALDRAFSLFATTPHEQALVSPNLTVPLISHPRLSTLGPWPAPPTTPDLVLVEQPPYGVTWPLSHEQVRQLISSWRGQPDTQVLIDDGKIFMARGHFNQGA